MSALIQNYFKNSKVLFMITSDGTKFCFTCGMLFKKIPPYDFFSMRLSKTVITPLSLFERINLPKPCLNLITASGMLNSKKGFPPRRSINAAFAKATG